VQPEDWEDGAAVHVAVGHYPANGFGLHEVAGNVSEWCFDGLTTKAYKPGRPKDHWTPHGPDERVVTRGGSFAYPAIRARSSNRDFLAANAFNYDIGLRPVRRLTARDANPSPGHPQFL